MSRRPGVAAPPAGRDEVDLAWLGTFDVPAGCSAAGTMERHALLARDFDFPTTTYRRWTARRAPARWWTGTRPGRRSSRCASPPEARTLWHATYDVDTPSVEVAFDLRDETGASRYTQPLRFTL